MTYSFHASGHADSKEAEAELIEAVSSALKAAGGGTASGNFQHHGAVDLFADAPTTEDESK